MKRPILLCIFLLSQIIAWAQPTAIPVITELGLAQAPAGKLSKYWLQIASNSLSEPIYVPIMVAKGLEDGPVLGLTAAIHGNELNGIPIIQEAFRQVDPTKLKGTLVGVPGLNAISIPMDRRRFPDEEDLNRLLPGKENGDESQQYAWRIYNKIVRHFDYHIDLHTASFGRINSLYVRSDIYNDTLMQMARLQDAVIILHNEGKPSAGQVVAASRTLRAEAMLAGIHSITVEYGDPQVYQPEMIERGVLGVLNTLSWLGMINRQVVPTPSAVVCKKSYWIYVDEGGLLEVPVELKQLLLKGDRIGILRNPFGDIIREYFAPEPGIVIGKSSNPSNGNGGRIIHLGVLR